MCDYSLHDVETRPAKVGERLITTKFNKFTGGFAAVSDPNVAVCLMPGTELAFEAEAVTDSFLSRLLPRSRFGKIGDKVARFRQLDMNQPNTHHDALEFANGEMHFVTRLRKGQRAVVLQLPSSKVSLAMRPRIEPTPARPSAPAPDPRDTL